MELGLPGGEEREGDHLGLCSINDSQGPKCVITGYCRTARPQATGSLLSTLKLSQYGNKSFRPLLSEQHIFFFLNFLFYIGVLLINSVVTVSGVQKVIQLYIYMYQFFFKFFSHLDG